MEMTNLYQVCIFTTISLMVFSLCVNVFAGFHIFGNVGEMGPGVNMSNSNETFQNFTRGPDYPSGLTITSIWGMVLSGSVVVGVFLAWVTQDASILGVFIFSGVFWSAFINTLVIITAIGIPVILVTLFTVPIFFIFIGAVIGMLSGV
jgi:hypothetical protein